MYTERDADRFNSSTITMYCTRSSTGPQEPQARPRCRASRRSAPRTRFSLTNMPFTNLRWFFAIRAVDAANNTGRISSIVSAFVPDPPTPPLSTITTHSPRPQMILLLTLTPTTPHATEGEEAEFANTGLLWIAVGAGGMVSISCRRAQVQGEKDLGRPIYKIYVNNASVQEEGGGIKVLSNEKIVDDKEPSQV